MPNLGATEIIIICVVVLILFGAKKLPEASRSLGRSLRILKSETKGLHDEDDDKDKKSSEQHQPAAEPQRLSSSESQPVMDGKVVGREQAHRQSH